MCRVVKLNVYKKKQKMDKTSKLICIEFIHFVVNNNDPDYINTVNLNQYLKKSINTIVSNVYIFNMYFHKLIGICV